MRSATCTSIAWKEPCKHPSPSRLPSGGTVKPKEHHPAVIGTQVGKEDPCLVIASHITLLRILLCPYCYWKCLACLYAYICLSLQLSVSPLGWKLHRAKMLLVFSGSGVFQPNFRVWVLVSGCKAEIQGLLCNSFVDFGQSFSFSSLSFLLCIYL